jgi:hypothetical protein
MVAIEMLNNQITAKALQRQQFIGVDLSGGMQASRNTWVCVLQANPTGAGLQVVACHSLSQWPTHRTGANKGQGNTWLTLFEVITAHPSAIVGIDASFSVPKPLLNGVNWEAWVTQFPTTYPTAEAFKTACLTQTEGKELKRLCDIEAKTPFSPYNLRHYKQTYTVVREVLRPLLQAGKACILPFMPPQATKPWVLECCPASWLKRLGLTGAYKGNTPSHLANRQTLLSYCQSQFSLTIAAHWHQALLTNTTADALDSLLIACQLWQLWHQTPGVFQAKPTALQRLEGHVFLPC